MPTYEFDTQEELDDAVDRVTDLQFEHKALKEEVEQRRQELNEAEDELKCFEEDNKEFLIAL